MVFFTTLALAAALRAGADAPEPDAPAALSLRLSAQLGGSYDTNVYGTASAQADAIGLARWTVYADWLASDDVIVKLDYRGELAHHRETTVERQRSHLGHLSLGLRLLDDLYLALYGGAEQVTYPRRDLLSFSGVFGETTARLELGEASTVALAYRLRRDEFASYDLDNVSHRAEARLVTMAGDRAEVELPISIEWRRYSERFLLDAAGRVTPEARTGRRISASPHWRCLCAIDTRVTVTARGELNDSNDGYFYSGPFGASDPATTPELITHFDAYRAASAELELSQDLLRAVEVRLRLAGGVRGYGSRPAFDASGAPTAAKQTDRWIAPGVDLEARLHESTRLLARYAFARQWSNDPMWDFAAHRAEVAVALHLGL